MKTVAFDLDGTLLEAPAGMNYNSLSEVSRLKPLDAVVSRARALRRLGHELVVVTGRRETLRWITELQVAVLLGEGVPVVMQPDWRGVDSMVATKAAALQARSVWVFVGDSRVDARAAELAGTPFLHSTQFGDGVPFSPSLAQSAP